MDNVEIVGDEGIQRIAEALELKFTNLISDKDYLMKLLQYVEGTPTTFVLGKEGEFLMDSKIGTMGVEKDVEFFKNIIQDIL